MTFLKNGDTNFKSTTENKRIKKTRFSLALNKNQSSTR